jgi:hypothetical protein
MSLIASLNYFHIKANNVSFKVLAHVFKRSSAGFMVGVCIVGDISNGIKRVIN